MLCLYKGNTAEGSCSIGCTSFRNEIKKVFWVFIFEKFIKETKFSVKETKFSVTPTKLKGL